jgi:hypothetical protein
MRAQVLQQLGACQACSLVQLALEQQQGPVGRVVACWVLGLLQGWLLLVHGQLL